MGNELLEHCIDCAYADDSAPSNDCHLGNEEVGSCCAGIKIISNGVGTGVLDRLRTIYSFG